MVVISQGPVLLRANSHQLAEPLSPSKPLRKSTGGRIVNTDRRHQSLDSLRTENHHQSFSLLQPFDLDCIRSSASINDITNV